MLSPYLFLVFHILSFPHLLTAVASVVVIGGFMMCIVICCSKYRPTRQVKFWLTIKRKEDIESILENHWALALKRYKFSDVKKITNSFNIKLGQGDFGSVYKGKLLTGCPVAVKLLNSSKGNGEEFINEVVKISKTSHVNVVTLIGFCFEGQKKGVIMNLCLMVPLTSLFTIRDLKPLHYWVGIICDKFP